MKGQKSPRRSPRIRIVDSTGSGEVNVGPTFSLKISANQSPEEAGDESKKVRPTVAQEKNSKSRNRLCKKMVLPESLYPKLQAVIRGEIVRRRLIAKLKFMLPLHQKTNTRVCQIKLPTLEHYHDNNDKKLINSPRKIMKSKELKLKCKSLRTSNFNLASEQDSEALWSRREEAIDKREHLMKYSFLLRENRNDRTLHKVLTSKQNRRSYKFDQLAELEAPTKVGLFEKLRLFRDSNVPLVDMNGMTQPQVRKMHREDCIEDLHSPSSLRRRSFSNVKRKSNVDVKSLPSSPIFPTYIAATESTKAKTRSMSTPKQHLRLHETLLGQHSPYNLKNSSWRLSDGEMYDSARKSRTSSR
ncbi:protein IQ-DOMAIN 12-like [Solanum dulcamara]|uniref:protein IQ-DOMAIN 12-like n=1 Tax=Solanum dulcamara TaxID=45834 RepID=UPI0024851F2B|nr:protein IQ-DOMAIN 12-like [Solanum dulcamara]